MHTLYKFLGAMLFGILTTQCAEQGVIKSVNKQAYDIIFADHSRFSHEDLMAFGLAWKSNHQYLCATAKERKNYFLMLIPMTQKRCDFFKWHVYGSRADCKIVSRDDLSYTTNKRLTLERLELSDNAKIKKYYGSWPNFDSELSYKPTPFCTTNKELWFFGFGWENVPLYGLCGNVICYQASRMEMNDASIKQEYFQEAVRCVLCLCGNKDNKHTVGTLLEYPYLLQAILKKEPGEKRIVPVGCQKDDCYFLYHLQDVIIPDNYKEFVQCWPEQISYKTFDDLPKTLKKAVIQQYEKQKNIHHD